MPINIYHDLRDSWTTVAVRVMAHTRTFPRRCRRRARRGLPILPSRFLTIAWRLHDLDGSRLWTRKVRHVWLLRSLLGEPRSIARFLERSYGLRERRPWISRPKTRPGSLERRAEGLWKRWKLIDRAPRYLGELPSANKCTHVDHEHPWSRGRRRRRAQDPVTRRANDT